MSGTISSPRIAILGAGSYVFTLGLLNDLLNRYPVPGSTLVLMDVDAEMAETMAAIARHMARELGIPVAVEATADRSIALTGADFVTTSVAVQLRTRWEMDKAVIIKHGIREVTSECGGVGGLSYTLRQVALLVAIARDMERLCPHAWLLNVSNPLPRVVTAVTRHTSIRTLGFCNASWGGESGYANIAGILGRDPRDLNVLSAGLNHFAWLLGVTDRWTGGDLLPMVSQRLTETPLALQPYTMKLWQQTGYLPLAGDPHTGEFLAFDAEVLEEHPAHHGDAAERLARRQALREAAAGTRPWQTLLRGLAWEHPAEVIHALATGTHRRLDMVNLPNHGAITGLPDDAVVEVPALIADDTVTPIPIGAIPAPLTAWWQTISTVHTLSAEAAVTGNRALLDEAIDLDPAITDKPAAKLAMTDLAAMHSDVVVGGPEH